MFCLRRATLLFAALTIPFSAWGQSRDLTWKCTFGAGAGYSSIAGKDSSNLSGQWDFETGAGLGYGNDNWRLFFNIDYLFDQASVKQTALSEAQSLNPTNIGLLNATGGTSRFNVVAFDPTLRISVSNHAEIYFFGGFGWFRRQVDLTGISNQGSLLQPGNPSVFLRNATSGSIDGGAGINFKNLKIVGKGMLFAEIRVVHGLAVNSSTTLVPFAAGIRW